MEVTTLRPLENIFDAIDAEYSVLKDQLQAWERARSTNDLSHDTQSAHASAAELKRHIDELVNVVPKPGAKNPLRPADEQTLDDDSFAGPEHGKGPDHEMHNVPASPPTNLGAGGDGKPGTVSVQTPAQAGKSPGHIPPKK
jgi:hypothetical protein